MAGNRPAFDCLGGVHMLRLCLPRPSR
jgi:hypothetical protein